MNGNYFSFLKFRLKNARPENIINYVGDYKGKFVGDKFYVGSMDLI